MRRTGTPPYMAGDLLNPYRKDVHHLYRHDLESLFYVVVTFVVRYKIGKPTRTTQGNRRSGVVQLDDHPALEDWFDAKQSWQDLRAAKNWFVLDDPEVVVDMIKPDFRGFEEWVIQIRQLLHQGLSARREAAYMPPAEPLLPIDPAWFGSVLPSTPSLRPEKVPYSEETLGDFVTYRNWAQIMVWFGEERLKIRYRYQVQP